MLRRTLIPAILLCLIAGGLPAMFAATPADTRVADAAMRGDTTSVRDLLKQGADVNAAQGDGMTALHWAAFKDDLAMAQMLLYAGANVKATTRLGDITPLLTAAKNGYAPIIEVLLKAGAGVNATTNTGMTALMLAAAAGDPESVRLLLAAGADVNAWESTHGQTALMFAAAYNRSDAIRILMQHGADSRIATKIQVPPARPNFGRSGRGAAPPSAGAAPAQGRATAPAAAATVEAQAAQARAEAPAAAGTPAATARGARGATLQEPASPATPPSGDPARAQSPNRDGQQQQGGGNDEERQVPPDPQGGLKPLLYAARQGNMEAVRALLDEGADINDVSAGDASSPLLIAAINGHFDLAMLLLERGADPKLASVAGATPLYGVINVQWAPKAFYPQPSTRREKTTHLELIQALLQRGADPNAKLIKELWYTGYNFGLGGADPTGATAFWRAAQVGDLDVMRLLVSHGADPNIASRDGITPLLACSGAGFHGNDEVTVPAGRMPAMRYMVEELKADINAVDSGTRGGHSAIHNAASRGDNEMILYLVSHGARVDLVSKSGQTTVDMANGPRQRVQPYPETIALLSSLGAKNSHKCVSC